MQADWMCCLVNTSEGKPHMNKSLVIIPMNLPGVQRSRKLHKLGMWSSDTAEIFFDDVRIPQRYRIGAEGMGFMMQMQQFQEERIWGAANVIKGLEIIIQDTIDYVSQRMAFGQSILDNQVVHFRLAELATEVETLRALVYRCTEIHMEEQERKVFKSSDELLKLASMCKRKLDRSPVKSPMPACNIGWNGIIRNQVARSYRDSRLVSIGGGADEVMLGSFPKSWASFKKRMAPTCQTKTGAHCWSTGVAAP